MNQQFLTLRTFVLVLLLPLNKTIYSKSLEFTNHRRGLRVLKIPETPETDEQKVEKTYFHP